MSATATAAAAPEVTRDASARIGDALVAFLRNNKLGTASKQDLEVAIFQSLVEGGQIQLDWPVLRLARELELSPARVRTLLVRFRLKYGYSYEMRKAKVLDPTDRSAMEQYENRVFREVFEKAQLSRTGERVEFLVRDPFFKQIIIDRFEREGVTIDGAFSSSILRVPIESFIEMYVLKMGDSRTTQWKKKLGKDPSRALRTRTSLFIDAIRAGGGKLLGTTAGDVIGDLVDDVLSRDNSQRGSKA